MRPARRPGWCGRLDGQDRGIGELGQREGVGPVLGGLRFDDHEARVPAQLCGQRLGRVMLQVVLGERRVGARRDHPQPGRRWRARGRPRRPWPARRDLGQPPAVSPARTTPGPRCSAARRRPAPPRSASGPAPRPGWPRPRCTPGPGSAPATITTWLPSPSDAARAWAISVNPSRSATCGEASDNLPAERLRRQVEQDRQPKNRSTSRALWIRLSLRSQMNAAIKPMTGPATSPLGSTSDFFGLLGLPGTPAGVVTFPPLLWVACSSAWPLGVQVAELIVVRRHLACV